MPDPSTLPTRLRELLADIRAVFGGMEAVEVVYVGDADVTP